MIKYFIFFVVLLSCSNYESNETQQPGKVEKSEYNYSNDRVKYEYLINSDITILTIDSHEYISIRTGLCHKVDCKYCNK